MYKEKVSITSVDVDCNYELKLSNLFKYLQIVASNHVGKLHASHQEIVKHNLLWVVIRMDVKIFRTPILDEEVTISTHPGETRSIIFPRFFEVYDSKGKLIISASSLWALMDKTTRTVVLKPDGFVKIKGEVDKDDLSQPEKIIGEASNEVDKVKVKYTDLDLNGHLNNTSYIEYILNTHDSEFYKKHRISSFSINYDKEIKDGEEIKLCSNQANPEIIKGVVDDNTRFTAKVEYIEK